MQQPMLPIMQQTVQQPNSSQPIPHHTLIGATSVPGISNQVVSYENPPQQVTLPMTEYYNEVFSVDPHICSISFKAIRRRRVLELRKAEVL